MGYILIQPDKILESLNELNYLAETVECIFELRLNRPMLYPVVFGSRSNLHDEEYYHFL